MLTDEQRTAFEAAAGDMLIRDKYGKYTICNIYLDTDDFYFIEHSLDKPVYKEKLRVRSYGTASDDSKVFFEIKKKYNLYGYQVEIDELANKFMNDWSIDRLDKTGAAILRMGVFEVKYTDTPEIVVINEAIELAKKYSDDSVRKIINAVLEKIKE